MSIGLAFQIVDDVLDVTQTSEQLGKTAGKDTAAEKATYPAVRSGRIGEEGGCAGGFGDGFAGSLREASGSVKDLARFLVERKK